mmetsp:Transcript_13790/g.29752  ORF Transcript_13790/g.29752 Transcript_13790/m.29752 type:complete len:413 (-) Transcript_13790:1101-2339(-)|eukprot:CAMPEP_0202900798 /NCGR_PEP_ID=MMETSP1392-20130828/12040_1 /ASSEMBLY_ACC=CAM_ASM_000868 /TAXON_ID=225041 /ORGANISM="Chlamydomonas chlamydogama, Strain SAG 11-48b" /LENGTH=412 /DNA_ID=CAMNT_0049587243 /DNA_START=68 /DNA_END=1306 /DNA_ORIENTATION=+
MAASCLAGALGCAVDDPVDKVIEDLKAKHATAEAIEAGRRLTGLADARLGFEDPEVQAKFAKAEEIELELQSRECTTFCCWSCPALCNAFCYPCKDIVGLEKDPGPRGCCNADVKPENTDGEYAELVAEHPGERIIIMSCPGDHYPWPGRSKPVGLFQGSGSQQVVWERGMIHTEFSKYQSNDVKFCPIQMQENEGPKAKAVAHDDTYQWWKAYWLANVVEALAFAKQDYNVRRVTLIKIDGGGVGSEDEKKNLQEQAMVRGFTDLLDSAIGCLFHLGLCFASFGAYGFLHFCCPGTHSWIHLCKALVKRFLLCASIRTFEAIDFKVVHPSDLQDYLEGRSPELVEIGSSSYPKGSEVSADQQAALQDWPAGKPDAQGRSKPSQAPNTEALHTMPKKPGTVAVPISADAMIR